MRNDDNWKMIAPTNKTRLDSVVKQLLALRRESPMPIDPDSEAAKKLGCTYANVVAVQIVTLPDQSLDPLIVLALPHEFTANQPDSRCVTVRLADNPIL